MRFKIRGGTADHGEPSLCVTCRFATIVKGQRLRDEIVECSRLSDHSRITFAVGSCSGYADRRSGRPPRDGGDRLGAAIRSAPESNRLRAGEKLKPQDRYVLPG